MSRVTILDYIAVGAAIITKMNPRHLFYVTRTRSPHLEKYGSVGNRSIRDICVLVKLSLQTGLYEVSRISRQRGFRSRNFSFQWDHEP